MSDFLINLISGYYSDVNNADILIEFQIHKRHWELNEYIILKTIYDEVNNYFLTQYAVYCDDVKSPKFGFYETWHDYADECVNFGEFIEL